MVRQQRRKPWSISLQHLVVVIGTIGTLVSTSVFAEAAGALVEPLVIPKFTEVDIQLDGALDEAVWSQVPSLDNMRVIEPDVLSAARYVTDTRIFYTDQGLYVGTYAMQPPASSIARLSSRDGVVNRDGTYLYLDTSGKGIYGLFFGVNLGGSLLDGTLLPENQQSSLWDGPWDGRSRITENGYTTEMFLPWSMMSMPDTQGVRTMALALERRVAHLDETWGWPPLPATQPQFLSGFQPIRLEDVHAGQQLAFFPFLAATRDRAAAESSYQVGTDIFWRPSSDLQLTATLNPDFGTVESDDVIVNLTAFETFFPEKRLFFLEGNATFITSPRSEIRGTNSSTGARAVPNLFFSPPTTLVNTRRIGGAARPPTLPAGVTIPAVELSKPSELIGAFKTTGNRGPFQYGVLLAAEEDTKFHGSFADGTPVRVDQDGREFAVARFLYENTTDGRKAIGWLSTLVDHPEGDAYTHGMDLHYRSRNSQIIWDGQLLHSDVDSTLGYGGYVDVNYAPRQGIFHRFSLDYLDDKLDISDFGFIRRNDVVTYRYTFQRRSSNLRNFRSTGNGFTLSHETNTDGRMVRSSVFYRNTLTFMNSNQLNSIFIYRPAQWDDTLSDGNGDFRVDKGGVFEFAYGSDTSQKVSASVALNGVTEAFGDWSYTLKGGITFKPNDRFSFDFDFQYRLTDNWLIHLDGPLLATYDAGHWQPVIGMDVFFSAKQQLRFSLQWVGIDADAQQLYRVPAASGELIPVGTPQSAASADFAVSRLTTQLRYRWEIAPLSDLFVVYTRGSNVPDPMSDSFDDLFHDALIDPVVDRFVIKLRYRFGN